MEGVKGDIAVTSLSSVSWRSFSCSSFPRVLAWSLLKGERGGISGDMSEGGVGSRLVVDVGGG